MLDKSKKSYQKLLRLLIEARHSKGLTQTEVGKRIGKRQTFVSKYELGERRLDVVEFLLICKAMNVSYNGMIKKLGLK